MVLQKNFLIGHSQTRTAYGGHRNFVQAKQFQRRRFFLEIHQAETQIPMVAMFVNGSERNEQS